MRSRLRRDPRGLSEIVGTLMLVVIVVGAAVAFSLFIASYEKQVTAEETIAHNRALEDIRVLSIETVLNATTHNTTYSLLNFTAGSLDVNTMTINELLVNGQFVDFYSVRPLGSNTTFQVCELCNVSVPEFAHTTTEFNLTSEEQVTITVNLTTWNPLTQHHGGFLDPYTLDTSGATNYVAISLYTTLGNDFSRVYSAPTAVIQVTQSETFSGGVYVPVVVFNGGDSIVPSNDTIVAWNWTVTGTGFTPGTYFPGEEVLIPQSEFTSGDTYTITLLENDAAGLVDSTTTQYKAA
jgi:flagellin-like protein